MAGWLMVFIIAHNHNAPPIHKRPIIGIKHKALNIKANIIVSSLFIIVYLNSVYIVRDDLREVNNKALD
jgi:hypothetical protein